MNLLLDDSPFSLIVKHHLENDAELWLTTVTPEGTPVPGPVWFIWENDAFLILTTPGSPKMNYLVTDSIVSLHFNCDPEAEHVVVFTGRVAIERPPAPIEIPPAYLEKYREIIRRTRYTWESVARDYSVILHIKPGSLREY